MTKDLALMTTTDVRQISDSVAKSRLFKGFENPEAAFALMMLCQAEGLHPIHAVRRYDVIDGKPAMKSDAMLADFMKRGGKVKWLKYTATAVAAEFHSHGLIEPVVVEWTIEMAKTAGLAAKNNWRNFPRAMLKARVISEGIRIAMPEVVGGTYASEEVSDFPEVNAPEYIPPVAAIEAVVVEAPRSEAPKASPAPTAVPAPSAAPSSAESAPSPSEREPGSDDGDDAEAMDDPSDKVECFDSKGVQSWEPRRTPAQNREFHRCLTEREMRHDGEDHTDNKGTVIEGYRKRLKKHFGKTDSSELSVREMGKILDLLNKATAMHGTPEQKRERQQQRVIDASEGRR